MAIMELSMNIGLVIAVLPEVRGWVVEKVPCPQGWC